MLLEEHVELDSVGPAAALDGLVTKIILGEGIVEEEVRCIGIKCFLKQPFMVVHK